MSTHYHVLLHINANECKSTSAIDIAKKWHMLFKGNDISQRFVKCDYIEPYERESLDTLIDAWRRRLQSISWVMKVT